MFKALAFINFLAALTLVACTQSTVSPARLGPGFPRGAIEIRYQVRAFVPVLGPVRADLLAVERLETTGLALKDKVVEQRNDGSSVLMVPGIPLNQGFLVLFHGKEPAGLWISGSAYPTCQPGAGAYVYTAMGAAPPPPPFGPVTPSAPYPGGPTPTPAPTPSIGPYPVKLSSDGLLASGWPQINLEVTQPGYQGVAYRYSSSRYIDELGADTSIPPGVLEELEVLSITYRIDADLPPPLTALVKSGPVTDRVRVWRFKDRPASEVIVVDQCPADFQVGQFLLYQAREEESP